MFHSAFCLDYFTYTKSKQTNVPSIDSEQEKLFKKQTLLIGGKVERLSLTFGHGNVVVVGSIWYFSRSLGCLIQ